MSDRKLWLAWWFALAGAASVGAVLLREWLRGESVTWEGVDR